MPVPVAPQAGAGDPNISNINLMEPSGSGGPSQGGPSQGGPSQGGPSQGGPSQGGPSQGAPFKTPAETEQEMLDSFGGDSFHVPPVADYIRRINRVGNLADQLSNTNLGESSSSKSGPSNK